jgi:hypothetical protein
MVNKKSIVEDRELVACNVQLTDLKTALTDSFPNKNFSRTEITTYMYNIQFSKQSCKIKK